MSLAEQKLFFKNKNFAIIFCYISFLINLILILIWINKIRPILVVSTLFIFQKLKFSSNFYYILKLKIKLNWGNFLGREIFCLVVNFFIFWPSRRSFFSLSLSLGSRWSQATEQHPEGLFQMRPEAAPPSPLLPSPASFATIILYSADRIAIGQTWAMQHTSVWVCSCARVSHTLQRNSSKRVCHPNTTQLRIRFVYWFPS